MDDDAYALSVLDRWVPDQEPAHVPEERPKQPFALTALLWTCNVAVWVGIVIVSLVAMFFAAVILMAFLK